MRKFLRVLFSRYALCAIFILADLILLALMAFYAYSYSWIIVIASGFINLLVFVSIINRDTNPEFKIPWLAAVLLLPLFGGALYIIFYHRRLRRGEAEFLYQMIEKMEENERICGESERSVKCLGELSELSKRGGGSALSLLSDDRLAGVFTGCVSTYYSTGESIFADMLTELSRAERFIFLEYFIIEDGVMWRSILKILEQKVKAGVTVRILYDDIGCMSTLPSSFCKELAAKGIECHRFAKVTPKLTSSHNNRDHRKICVIDGVVAFTGGVNIADEYINERRRFGHWKDGGIKVKGDAARGFTRLFLVLYDMTSRKISDYSFFLPPVSKKSEKSLESGYLIPFGSGPYPAYRAPVGKNVLMNIINTSERYLYITTPYLIIDYDLTEALRSAAKRGVDVRIITPNTADKRIIKIMTKSSYPYLLEGGVRIFEYSPGFIHEKLVVCDDLYAMVGTINFDYRSLVHHFEDGAWIFRDPVVLDIRDSFMETQRVCEEMLACDCKLTFSQKVIRDMIRIFAPLL